MPPSSEAATGTSHDGRPPEARIARTAELAATGYASRLLTPGRVHAVNGHLHNLAMLADLAARQAADAAAGGTQALVQRRRVEAITSEVRALEREIALWQSLQAYPLTARYGRCDATPALQDAARVLEAEATRLQVRLRTHLPDGPLWIASGPEALLQSVVACAAAELQSTPRGTAATIAARRGASELVVEIASASANQGDPLEPDLLDELVRAAGGRFDRGPPMRLAFPRAADPRARIDG